MKLTKAQLKQIIKEELKATMDEGFFGKAMDRLGVGGAGKRVWRAYQTMHPGDFTQMMRGKKPSAPASSSFDPSARIKDPKAVKAAINTLDQARQARTAHEKEQIVSSLDPVALEGAMKVLEDVAGASKLRHEIDPKAQQEARELRDLIG